MRGVKFVRRIGAAGSAISFTDYATGCVWLWLDGGYVGNSAIGGVQLDDFLSNPAEIYAIEVYAQSNEVPPQFTGTMRPVQVTGKNAGPMIPTPPDHCGAVVIWTKEHASP